MVIPDRKIDMSFYPRHVVLNSPYWVNEDAKTISMSQGVTANIEHVSSIYIDDVPSGSLSGDIDNLAFRDPHHFVSGELHNH